MHHNGAVCTCLKISRKWRISRRQTAGPEGESRPAGFNRAEPPIRPGRRRAGPPDAARPRTPGPRTRATPHTAAHSRRTPSSVAAPRRTTRNATCSRWSAAACSGAAFSEDSFFAADRLAFLGDQTAGRRVGRPDRLVRLLRAFLRLVARRLGRHGSLAERGRQPAARRDLGLGSDHHRIRAQAGDLPRLIELLRGRHRVRHRQA